MMQPKFMSSTRPNIHRLFSQREFEESLNALTQLSSQAETAEIEEELCWEEAAQDIENFLKQSLSTEATVIGYEQTAESQESESA